MGDYSYEEYFSMPEELSTLKTKNSQYMTLWELACYFYIYDEIINAKGHYICYKKQADYLFTNLDSKDVIGIREKLSSKDIESCMAKYKAKAQVLNEDDRDCTAGTIFLNYHRWGKIDLISGATLASFLALWLK